MGSLLSVPFNGQTNVQTLIRSTFVCNTCLYEKQKPKRNGEIRELDKTGYQLPGVAMETKDKYNKMIY